MHHIGPEHDFASIGRSHTDVLPHGGEQRLQHHPGQSAYHPAATGNTALTARLRRILDAMMPACVRQAITARRQAQAAQVPTGHFRHIGGQTAYTRQTLSGVSGMAREASLAKKTADLFDKPLPDLPTGDSRFTAPDHGQRGYGVRVPALGLAQAAATVHSSNSSVATRSHPQISYLPVIAQLARYASELARIRANDRQPHAALTDLQIVDYLIESENALTPGLNLCRFRNLGELGGWLHQKVRNNENFHQRAFLTIPLNGDVNNPHHVYADIFRKDGQLTIRVVDGLKHDDGAAESLKAIYRQWPPARIIVHSLAIQSTFFECMNLALSHAKKGHDHETGFLLAHDKAFALPNGLYTGKKFRFSLPPAFYKHATRGRHLEGLNAQRPELQLKSLPINKRGDTLFNRQARLLVNRTIVDGHNFLGQFTYARQTYSTSLEHRRERFVARAMHYFQEKQKALERMQQARFSRPG
jgi:hypothetical protein